MGARRVIRGLAVMPAASIMLAGCASAAHGARAGTAPSIASSPTRSSVSPAFSPTPQPSMTDAHGWPTLAAVVAAFGTTAVASVPVQVNATSISAVIHATELDASGRPRGETAEVVSYRDKAWHVIVAVRVYATSNDGPPTARYRSAGWPAWVGPSWSAPLTGATDFVLPAFYFTDAETATVLSDVGGRWHLVPFRTARGPMTIVTVDREDRVGGPVLGDAFITGTNDCTPACAGGTIHYQRWRYQADASAFVPDGAAFVAGG